MKCCDLTAGMLRTPIAIEEYAGTPDGRGGQTKQWSPVLETRSHWRHASPYERLQAMKVNAGALHRVYIRFSPGITPKMRLVKDGEPFQLRGVVDIEERHLWLELVVEEGQPT